MLMHFRLFDQKAYRVSRWFQGVQGIVLYEIVSYCIFWMIVRPQWMNQTAWIEIAVKVIIIQPYSFKTKRLKLNKSIFFSLQIPYFPTIVGDLIFLEKHSATLYLKLMGSHSFGRPLSINPLSVFYQLAIPQLESWINFNFNTFP